ncbi:MAG TPA: heparin lyase I family protein [Azospirillum sp.]|nr:heparin lyase I family protein [Azospirillum sp.]
MTRTAATLLLASLIGTAAAHADTVSYREDFEAWAPLESPVQPCLRPENIFTVQGDVVRDGRKALRMTLLPHAVAPPAASAGPVPWKGCLDPRNPAAPHQEQGRERAELWEAESLRLPFGSDVWYGFSMRIDGMVGENDNVRLVVGQWKGWGDASPFVAQRFKNRRFHITIQNDAAPEDGGGECRILLAYQPGLTSHAESFRHTTKETTAGLCARDVTVERFAPLPDPFGRWVDMVYHIRPSLGSDGIVEVWADGVRIARATGRIGLRLFDNVQYFKFGPYRDHAPYPTTVYLDNLARGRSYEEVAPRGR